MKQYRLLKDLPGIKAGKVVIESDQLTIKMKDAKYFPEFFEFILDFEMQDGDEGIYSHLHKFPKDSRDKFIKEDGKEIRFDSDPRTTKRIKDELRDQFAASAMQALVAGNLKRFENPTNEADIYVPLLTNFAYTIAENMLIARSKYVKGPQ